MAQADRIAKLMLQGFQRHYQLFCALTDDAGQRFLRGDWQGLQGISRDRISYYDRRVTESVETLRHYLPDEQPDEGLWQAVKVGYTDLLSFHPQAELAESFYNSVFCSLFHRRYYHNQFIFVETTIAGRMPVPVEAEYRSYFPVLDGVPVTLQTIIEDMGFATQFADLRGDVERLRQAFAASGAEQSLQAHQLRIDVLKQPFYRNKAAYVIGRIVTLKHSYPFIVPVLRNDSDGSLYADALLTHPQHMSVIFSFARAYFMVRAQAPSALVRFLQSLMPRKSKADLYAAIGLHKQGKTEFYRELLQHLANSNDQMVAAPGVRGLVMMVFTLPSFPYVFKVIRDRFGSTKEFGRDTVLARYQLVKRHDRVGRMADTIEYSNVALPLARISADLLTELKQAIGDSLEFEGDTVIIRHLYIEKRLTPLNIFLEYADEQETRAIINDYGQALKDMIAANIFPGDMLLKNFGVTRGRRVVFYDYDEVQYLTDMNFRTLPQSKNTEDMLMAADSHSVAPNDIFPQQLITYVFAKAKLKEIFQQLHPELLRADYWQGQQARIRAGEVSDVFPYPKEVRFTRYNPGE
ncbi:MAG: bifunctional isocitrate dehydrogenase kinase/phosphatase [Idiomarina sp.]|nr:bifunctional isocitrate dehydrogenase kinase/phosphatase [Idiomarina sp.]